MTGCTVNGNAMPLRIHGLLDDAARYVMALKAHTTEKESDILAMTVDALREAGRWKKKLVERDVKARIVGDLGTDGS